VNDTSLTEKSVDDEVRLSKEAGLSLSLSLRGKAKAVRKEGKGLPLQGRERKEKGREVWQWLL